jgi:hypothetical protein
MDRKQVKGLSIEEARAKLEEGLKPGEDALFYDMDRFSKPRPAPPSDVQDYAPPHHVKLPTEILAETKIIAAPAVHELERRRQLGRHYTKEILLSIGLLGVVTYFAWFFLRASAESSARQPVASAVVVAPATPPVVVEPPHVARPVPAAPPEPPKALKPVQKPKPTRASKPTVVENVDPEAELLNRSIH